MHILININNIKLCYLTDVEPTTPAIPSDASHLPSIDAAEVQDHSSSLSK